MEKISSQNVAEAENSNDEPTSEAVKTEISDSTNAEDESSSSSESQQTPPNSYYDPYGSENYAENFSSSTTNTSSSANDGHKYGGRLSGIILSEFGL